MPPQRLCHYLFCAVDLSYYYLPRVELLMDTNTIAMQPYLLMNICREAAMGAARSAASQERVTLSNTIVHTPIRYTAAGPARARAYEHATARGCQ